MKIKTMTLSAGPGGVIRPGIHNVPDELARHLVDAGAAVAVGETEKEVETATVQPERAAVDRRPKRKR